MTKSNKKNLIVYTIKQVNQTELIQLTTILLLSLDCMKKANYLVVGSTHSSCATIKKCILCTLYEIKSYTDKPIAIRIEVFSSIFLNVSLILHIYKYKNEMPLKTT